MAIPAKEECLKILKASNVPDNVVAHSKAVHDFAMKVADLLQKRGISINRDLVGAAALLHDIKKMNAKKHESEGAELVESFGYSEVAPLIKKHGLSNLGKDDYTPKTWEEKVVFYADKRVKSDKIVSLEQRFEYIKQRYKWEDIEKELDFTKKIEEELLGEEKIE